MTQQSMSKNLHARLERTLTDQYGYLVGGADLANLLGFRSTDTLRKAVANQTLSLKTFAVPGRQGRFALTAEVTDWLIALRARPDACKRGEGCDTRNQSKVNQTQNQKRR